jgi:hypothetical protein
MAETKSDPASNLGTSVPEKGEAVLEPLVEGFRIEARRIKDIDEIIAALSPLQFLNIVKTQNGVVLVNIERRDIRKEPYLFSIIYLNPDNLEVVYSYVPDVSPKKRRLEIIRYLLNVTTLLENVYFINHIQLYQVIDSILSRLFEYTASTYDELFSRYDALKEEVERLRRVVKEFQEANEKLGKSNIEYKEKENDLLLRIKELETYSDDMLMNKIQSWLSEHGYEINIADFARVNKVSEGRVEQVLNKMVREGYVTLKG